MGHNANSLKNLERGRWKPGQSGNPTGRAKGVVYPSELLHGLLAMDDDGKPRYTRFNLETIVEEENAGPALVIAARWITVDGQSYPLLSWTAKAKASYRAIPLPDETMDELRQWKAKAGKSAYVFVGLDRLEVIDRKLKAGTLRENHQRLCNTLRDFKTIQHHARDLLAKRRGVAPEAVPWRIGCIHDLRDTYFTSVKGLPIDVLKRIAGHSDVSSTLRFYTSATDRDASDVRRELANSGMTKPRIAVG